MSLRAQILIPVFLVMGSGILVGLIRRRLVSACYSFPGYLLVLMAYEALTWSWPERFWNHHYYMLKESVAVVLKLVLAAELAFRSFELFPGAHLRARLLAAPFLGLGLLMLLRAARAGVTTAHPVLADLQVLTLWLFTVTAGLSAYFLIPLGSFQRTLVRTMSTYLCLNALLLGARNHYGFDRFVGVADMVNAYAWTVLVAFWLVAAWRVHEPALSAELDALLRKRQAAA